MHRKTTQELRKSPEWPWPIRSVPRGSSPRIRSHGQIDAGAVKTFNGKNPMQATNRIVSIRIATSCRLDKDHKAPKETRIASSLDLVSIASKTLPNSAAQRMSPRQCKFTIVFLILMARRAVLRFNKRWSSAKASAGTSNTAADVLMLHDFR